MVEYSEEETGRHPGWKLTGEGIISSSVSFTFNSDNGTLQPAK